MTHVCNNKGIISLSLPLTSPIDLTFEAYYFLIFMLEVYDYGVGRCGFKSHHPRKQLRHELSHCKISSGFPADCCFVRIITTDQLGRTFPMAFPNSFSQRFQRITHKTKWLFPTYPMVWEKFPNRFLNTFNSLRKKTQWLQRFHQRLQRVPNS